MQCHLFKVIFPNKDKYYPESQFWKYKILSHVSDNGRVSIKCFIINK